MPRPIGELRPTYTTWTDVPAGIGRAAFRAVLSDTQGSWWMCEHRHASGSEALRCADAQLSRLRGGGGPGAPAA